MRLGGTVLVVLAMTTCAHADNWPQWRGPNGDGISSATGIPITWSEGKNIAWRTPLPGQGGATPAIWNDRIFVTSADGDDLVLMCISTSSEVLWKKIVTDSNQRARAGEGNSASASPCTDGEHVWVFFCRGEKFTSGILACYDFDGNEIWKFDVADRFGKLDIQFGLTSTPVLHGEYLYLQLIHGAMIRGNDQRTGKVIKLDKSTGNTVWEVDRQTDAGFECKHSYASPFMYDDGSAQFLVVHGANCTTGHDLKTGKELWRLSGLNGPTELNTDNYDPTFRFVSSPAVVEGMIVVPTCKGGPTITLRVNDELQGTFSGDKRLVSWTLPDTPDVSIPLVVDGLVYMLHKSGTLQCVDAKTGEELYHERTHTVQHRTSPIYAGGYIYFCGKDGVCTVVKAGREFSIAASNDMNGEAITASPVVAGDTLYIRSYDALYAIKR